MASEILSANQLAEMASRHTMSTHGEWKRRASSILVVGAGGVQREIAKLSFRADMPGQHERDGDSIIAMRTDFDELMKSHLALSRRLAELEKDNEVLRQAATANKEGRRGRE